MKCEFYHFIIHNTGSRCRETYPTGGWDFLRRWVKVCGIFTLRNVAFFAKPTFWGPILKKR